MKHKFELYLEEQGIEGLSDGILHPDFVKSAKEFLDFANNPESKPEQIREMDGNLIILFDKTHDVIIDDEGNDSEIQAKRMDAKLNANVDDFQSKIERLEKENAEKEKLLKQYQEKEKQEAAAKEAAAIEQQKAEQAAKEEQQRISNEAAQKNESFKKQLDLLVENGLVDMDELVMLGVPNVGASTIEWNGLVFKRKGLTMSRTYAVYDQRGE